MYFEENFWMEEQCCEAKKEKWYEDGKDCKDEKEDCWKNKNEREQRHTHEFLGSVKIAEKKEDPHNHRFAGVTGEAIPCGKSHIHKLETRTDFYEDHFHKICEETGLAIELCDGRHVHFVKGKTSENDCHRHEFIFATLIENPIGD